jgi:nucleoside-diphosphate-sugar epimerase
VDLLCCDCTLRDDKARAELGYRPVIGVEEGLRALASANAGTELGTPVERSR